jgi:hypothetical protein
MSTSGSATWALIDETRNTANNGYGYKIVTALDASNNGWWTTQVSLETLTGVNSQRILNSVAPRAKVTIYGAGGGGAGGSGGVESELYTNQIDPQICGMFAGSGGGGGGAGAWAQFSNSDVSATYWRDAKSTLVLGFGGLGGRFHEKIDVSGGVAGGGWHQWVGGLAGTTPGGTQTWNQNYVPGGTTAYHGSSVDLSNGMPPGVSGGDSSWGVIFEGSVAGGGGGVAQTNNPSLWYTQPGPDGGNEGWPTLLHGGGGGGAGGAATDLSGYTSKGNWWAPNMQVGSLFQLGAGLVGGNGKASTAGQINENVSPCKSFPGDGGVGAISQWSAAFPQFSLREAVAWAAPQGAMGGPSGSQAYQFDEPYESSILQEGVPWYPGGAGTDAKKYGCGGGGGGGRGDLTRMSIANYHYGGGDLDGPQVEGWEMPGGRGGNGGDALMVIEWWL